MTEHRAKRLEVSRCSKGHAFFESRRNCPICAGALRRTHCSPHARLIVHTTVRITPTGESLTLGVARTKCGARTLCIVDGKIRGTGRDRVVLRLEDGLYHALGRSARVERRATAGRSSNTSIRERSSPARAARPRTSG